MATSTRRPETTQGCLNGAQCGGARRTGRKVAIELMDADAATAAVYQRSADHETARATLDAKVLAATLNDATLSTMSMATSTVYDDAVTEARRADSWCIRDRAAVDRRGLVLGSTAGSTRRRVRTACRSSLLMSKAFMSKTTTDCSTQSSVGRNLGAQPNRRLEAEREQELQLSRCAGSPRCRRCTCTAVLYNG